MERKEGYYWVKFEGAWIVALYHDNNNSIDDGDWCWRSHRIDGKGNDDDFSEINEQRIPMPGEENKVFAGTYMNKGIPEPVYYILPKGLTLEEYNKCITYGLELKMSNPEQEAMTFLKRIKG